MALLPASKEVLHEMLRVQQVLRKTSPDHRLSDDDRKAIEGSIERAERALLLMRKDVMGG